MKKIRAESDLQDKMKNITIFLGYLILVFGYLTTASCQSKIKSTAVVIPHQDSLFKQWVKDTTDIIKKKPDKMIDGLVKSQFRVGEDSLSITEQKVYEFDSRYNSNSKEISNVLFLLKEYNEIPRGNYKLSFVSEKFFSSPIITGIKYDLSSELKDILIKTSQEKIEYKYIRGRLSGKKVFKINSSIKNQNYDLYDFDWNKNNLIKRKVKK